MFFLCLSIAVSPLKYWLHSASRSFYIHNLRILTSLIYLNIVMHLGNLCKSLSSLLCNNIYKNANRSGLAVKNLLGLRVIFPPWTWMSVSFECCQVEFSASSWSISQRSPTRCGVSVIVEPRPWGGLCPLGVIAPWNKSYTDFSHPSSPSNIPHCHFEIYGTLTRICA